METKRTIVLVLRSGGDFSFRDVELIARHIHGKWLSSDKPRIICLWDKASTEYNLGNIEFIPLKNNYPGTWSRMELYSPEMEKYRPFLYIDLDTVIFNSLENIFNLVKDPSQLIVLEDFWQKIDNNIATPLVWFPANSEKIKQVWKAWQQTGMKTFGFRMDYFLRKVVKADNFWQKLTNTIYDFKPQKGNFLTSIPPTADLVCFHGKPRIFDAADKISWVRRYINKDYTIEQKRVTVIIPYNRDRGWLKDAVKSVPDEAQLILSKGEGNWPENFNKVLNQATGEFIRYLHEDDMLTPNCIADSVKTIEEQNVDFIHGNAMEIFVGLTKTRFYAPRIINPTLADMLNKNYLHSATIMYRREVFDKVGLFDETLNTAEEYEFSLRCLKAGLKLGYCNSTLAYYRRHPEQKVRVVSSIERSREREQVRTLYR